MQKIINNINKHYSNLSTTQQKVANYVYYNLDDVVFYTATKLAKIIGVSDTTVIRFCMEIGYSGYSDFQNDVKTNLKSAMSPYNKFEQSIQELDKDHILNKVFLNDIDNLERTMSSTTITTSFEITIDKIINAKHVYVIASRNSSPFAEMLSISLDQILKKSTFIIPGNRGSFAKMKTITKDDFVITMVFPRYSRDTLLAIKYLKERSIEIAIITDNNLSITGLSDISFALDVKSISYIDSYSTCLSLINAIISAICIKSKDETKRSLAELEELFEFFGTFDKTNTY